MKTNQNLIRKMGGFEVTQRTKDGMFNASTLLKQWNRIKGNANLRIEKFLKQEKTKQFLEEMKMNSNGDNQPIPENQIVSKTKARTLTNGSRLPGEVWMHPFLFIDFAMWLNPKFKLKVIRFVYDELIKHRHLSGDYYNKLCASLARFDGVDYRELGRMLNYVVFNEHQRDRRNKATLEQQEDLQQLERDMCP